MDFEYTLKTDIPIDVVFNALRDDLSKLVEYLPNVKKIEMVERKKTKDRVLLLNKWYGKYQLPVIVNKLLNINEIAWLDKAEWISGEYACIWDFEPLIFKDYVSAHGKNFYTKDGKHTVIKVTGVLDVDFGKHPLVPFLLKNRINQEVSKISLGLIKPNFVNLLKGLEKYLKEQGKQH